MRKMTTVLVTVLLATSLSPVASGADSNRKVTRPYNMANGMVVHGSISSSSSWSVVEDWKELRSRSGERFVSLTISDNASQHVYGHVHLDADGNGQIEHVDFCDETRKPIRLGTETEIKVAVFLGTCADGTASVVTQGTISATFSK